VPPSFRCDIPLSDQFASRQFRSILASATLELFQDIDLEHKIGLIEIARHSDELTR
jgi:hypothetical protein